MNRAATFLATLLLSAALPGLTGIASAGDAADNALCDRIAAHVRGQPPAASDSRDIFAFALTGPHPWIEAPEPVDETVGDSDNDWAAYRASLATRFRPDAKLAAAFADFVPEAPQLASLPASPVHALVATGGTMHCQTFTFFETGFETGATSRKLPDLARGENEGSFCWNESGTLARVNDRPAFLYRYDAITSFEYQLGIVPLEEGNWGEGCRVDVTYRTVYTASTVSAPTGISADAFGAAAISLAMAGKIGTGQYVAFSQVPASQREAWNHLSAEAQSAVDLEWHEPSYGPLVIGQRVYFAAAMRQGVGWRENADIQVDLYALVQDKVQKVGSASLSAARGQLLSAKVLPGGVPR